MEFVDIVIMNVDDIYDESVGNEISKGKELHDRTSEYVSDIFKALNKGGQLDIDSVKIVVVSLLKVLFQIRIP